jgi:catechol 2,3-dioxygenase-like lactoylglutathione lyase family enzyme
MHRLAFRSISPALLLLWSGILCAQDTRRVNVQSGSQASRINGIAHIALRVTDLNRERRFLQSLGFEEAFAQTSGTTATEAFFKVNDRQFIELYPQSSETNPLGLMHICYESGSLQQLNALYVARGLPMSAVRKGGAGNLMSSLHDPFGQEIEFTQYLPGSRHFEDRGKHLGESRISDELQGIELPVSDLDQAKKFYAAELGFEERKRAGGIRLRISSDADQWIGLDASAEGARPKFVFRVPNAGRTTDQLRKVGLKSTLLNNSVSIADPEGNIFVFSDDASESNQKYSDSTH